MNQTVKDLTDHLKSKPSNQLIRLVVNGKSIWKTAGGIIENLEECDPESPIRFTEEL